MKSIFTYLIAIGITSLIWWWYCKSPRPCNPCDDPALVHVTPGSPSSVTHNWEFIQAVRHSNGTATSSISIVPAGTTSVNSVANDSTTTSINLVATDTLAGIHCIGIKGGFGFTCINPAGGPALAIDGIIPYKETCNNLTKCCLKSMQATADNIGANLKCGAGRVFSNGGVGITGIITNCNGVKDTVIINVVFH